MSFDIGSQIAQLAYCFGAGVLSSLTPCVYPMIPITLSIFGATDQTSRFRAFLLSLAYVLGISLTYTILGIICAQTGMLFGSLLGNMWVVLALTAFLVVLGLHSLEIFQLPLHRLQSSTQGVGGKGFLGALLMGLVSGFVAAPCVGPVLAVILVQASSSNSVLWSAAQLFSYSWGLGLIFLVLGTFSGAAKFLPRSGNWLIKVKSAVAVLVFITAFAVLGSLRSIRLEFESALSAILIGSVLALCSLFAFRGAAGYERSRRLAGCLSLALLICAVTARIQPQATHAQLSWIRDVNALLDSSLLQSQKPIMVDMYADWCAACEELDKHTFSNSQVATTLASEFTPVKLDLTNPTDQTQKISEKYNVVGLPCILFLNSKGEEIPGSRISGFLNPEQFLAHIRSIRAL